MTPRAAAVVVGGLGVALVLAALPDGRSFPSRLTTASAQAPVAGSVEAVVHNFGAPINSKWDEGELSFADDGTMVFTSSRQDLGAAPGDPKDLYIATFNTRTGTWNTPVDMGRPVNAPPATDVDPLRKGDDREPWISPDGNTIYFKSDRLATTTPRNINDIFVTHKVNGTWTTPERVPAPISTDAGDEHCPMLLRDGKTLCFASARPGGYGSFDIWCSQQRADATWQEPINQGPTINTAGSEFHFMEDRAGKWVYFTSTRAGGFGSADLYAARSLGPNQWGPAVNLGPQVNTAGMDMCPAVHPDGKTFCWFTSARTTDSLGMSDIYRTSQSTIDGVLATAK
jgi:Tol biopolymer transport system component